MTHLTNQYFSRHLGSSRYVHESTIGSEAKGILLVKALQSVFCCHISTTSNFNARSDRCFYFAHSSYIVKSDFCTHMSLVAWNRLCWLLCFPWREVMPGNRYSRQTFDTVDWEMLNLLSISKMECPKRLTQTIIPHSTSVNPSCAAKIRNARTFSYEWLQYKWKSCEHFLGDAPAVWIFPFCNGIMFDN